MLSSILALDVIGLRVLCSSPKVMLFAQMAFIFPYSSAIKLNTSLLLLLYRYHLGV